MSTVRSTRSVTWRASGSVAGSVDGTAPSSTHSPASAASASASYAAGASWSRSTLMPRAPGAADQRDREAGGAGVHEGYGAGLGDRGEDGLEGLRGLRRVHHPVPAEAGRGRDLSREHGRQRRLVDLHQQLGRPGQPAAQVGDVVEQALRERLGEVAPGAVVGEDLVAAGLLDGRGERPRSGDLHLERAGPALRLLLDRVEVLGDAATGPGGGRCPRRR